MIKKRWIATGLSVCCILSSMTACGGGLMDDSTEDVDKNRTQVYVGFYEGALGRDYAYELKRGYIFG